MGMWKSQIGQYQILRVLGQGSFADVYLGEHRYLKTLAAIKVLQAKVAHHEDLQAFLKEAQTIAQLVHPHIVRVLDFGEERQTPYLVMDYCPGGTLRKQHRSGVRISLPECIAYIKQVAAALQYAHDHHIVHRDVKPENMLVSASNTILLSDFGIALVAQSSRDLRGQAIAGTIAYTAPEQLQGSASAASDQYSLGIVLYEWLTGELPYRGSFSEIASQHLFAPIPSLREKVPILPLAVEAVVARALEKDPKRRWSSVLEFAMALERAQPRPGFSSALMAAEAPSQINASTGGARSSMSLTTTQQVARHEVFPVPTLPAHGHAPLPILPASPFPSPSPRSPHPSPQKSRISGRNILITLLLTILFPLTLAVVTATNSVLSGNRHAGGMASSSQASQPTPPPLGAPLGAQTIQEHLRLTCICDDPLVTTINAILIQPDENRMVWNITIYNNSAKRLPIYYDTFSLQSSSDEQSTYDGTGPIRTFHSVYDPLALSGGQTMHTTIVFSFVPREHASYVLHVHISSSFAHEVDVTFDPVTLTF
jgi:serine/threonine protein kinase